MPDERSRDRTVPGGPGVGLPSLFSRILTVLVLVIGVVAGALLVVGAAPEIHRATARLEPTDGKVDWIGAKAYWARQDPYSTEAIRKSGLAAVGGFGHPPTTPFWFLPLARLSLQMMSVALSLIVTMALAWQLLLLFTGVGAPMPLLLSWVTLGVVLSRQWSIESFHAAQISPMIGFLYVGAWWFLREELELEAGGLLGLACSMKLFPGVMVLYLLVTKRWRGVIAACAAYLFVALVMTERYGFRSWGEFFTQQHGVADRWLGNSYNASLHGIVFRLFHPSCESLAPVDRLPVVVSSLLALALLAGATVLVLRRRPSTDLSFSLFSLLSVFLSQWVWDHYYVLLLLPLVVVPGALVRSWRGGVERWKVATGLALAAGAAWGITGVERRFELQRDFAWRRQAHGHLLLHFHELLAWLPIVLLLVATFAAVWWSTTPGIETGTTTRGPRWAPDPARAEGASEPS